MSSHNYGWTGSNLRSLRKSVGISYVQLSSLTNISISSLKNYEDGRTEPGIAAVITLADFFGVSVDFLIDRSNEKDTPSVMMDYYEQFNAERKKLYENRLMAGRKAVEIPDGIEHPWPYNLIAEIFDVLSYNKVYLSEEDTEKLKTFISPLPEPHKNTILNILADPKLSPISDDQMDGLNCAMETLSDREQKAVHLYYKDGKNLDEIGKEFGVTRERIRQIIRKGVRKLRHPSRTKLIRYGVRGLELQSAKEKERLIQEKMKDIEKLTEQLESMEENVKKISEEKGMEEYVVAGIPVPLEELELSVRSYNCLKRRNVRTSNDIIELINDKTLHKVRNLGKKSVEEIFEKLNEYCGTDFSEVEYFKAS